jgi:tetratricopeptide (TPR) repeat protein
MAILAGELEALRVACGSPSYARLYKMSAMLPPATVSGVLNARTAPKLAFVLAFVRAVLAAADAAEVPVPAAERDLGLWKQRWERLHAPAGDGDTDVTGQVPRAVVPWQLPAAPRLLLGRDAELARLDSRLREAAGQLVLLVHGQAGVGKTALALAWAHRRQDDFPDGQLYADFAAGTGARELTAEEVLIDFLAALGHSPRELPADQSGLAGMFRSAVADRRMLVVLENAERAGDVRPFLPGSGESVVLVTARERIKDLAIFDGAIAEEVRELPAAVAIEMLQRYAPGVGPQEAGRVARACGYLPLPLRIAADTLQGASGELPGSADGLGGVISWSLGARSPADTEAVALLSLLPGTTFDGYEAAAVLGRPARRAPRVVSELAGSHLVAVAGPQRYELHPLVREHVGRIMSGALSAAARDAARTRLYGYYLWTADAADRILLPQRRRPELSTRLPKPAAAPRLRSPAAARTWAGENLASMTAAVVQAEVTGDELAYLLPHVLTSYLNLRKPWPQWQLMCQAGIRVARRYDRSEDLGNLEVSLGIALRETDRPAEAAAAFRRAYQSYAQAGQPVGQAMALNNLATIYTHLRQHEDAVTALTQALELLDLDAEPFRAAIALHNLAEEQLRSGRPDDALETIIRAHDVALAIGDRDGAAMSLATMAEIHDRLGNWSQAAAEYSEALAIQAQAGDSFGQIFAHQELGKLLIRHGRQSEGAQHLAEAARIEGSLPRVGGG